MYCRYKEKFEFYCLNAENGQEVLEKLGFGIEKCKETNRKDGRYGKVEYDHLSFGFSNKMMARFFFGNYVVFTPYNDMGYEYLNEKNFLEDYEIIE